MSASALDFAAISKATKVADSNDFPAAQPRARRGADPALVELVRTAQKDGKRRDLPGRFSLAPYEGRKNACEAFTVIGALHAAAREVGCKVHVRRLDQTATDTGLTFKVAEK